MQLAKLVQEEFGVAQEDVMLLRHAPGKTDALLKAGGTVHHYTAIQDVGGDYDFHHPDYPRTKIVVVVVHDRVYGVYRVRGVRSTGPLEAISPPEY